MEKSKIRTKVIGAKVNYEEYGIVYQLAGRRGVTVSEYARIKILEDNKNPSLFENGGNIKEDESIIKDNEKLKAALKTMTEQRNKWESDWRSRKAKYDKLEIEFKAKQKELTDFNNSVRNRIEPIRNRINDLVNHAPDYCPEFAPDLKDALKEIDMLKNSLK